MKNTSVTPSATLEAMPSPNQSAKIGASTTRGSALAILTYGSNTALAIGLRANQKPTSTPLSEPMKNASMASTSVIHRCFQIVPSTNHLNTRPATSPGVEKKNGGSRVAQSFSSPRYDRPQIGYLENRCQNAMQTIATRICSASSVRRLIGHPPPVWA